jgi:hypothetical protein
MRRAPILVLFLLAATVAVAGYLTLRGFALLGPPEGGARPVPDGCQEIACLSPATSADAWERLVAAVRFLQAQWAKEHPDLPRLDVDLEHVFTERTTDVPEFSLGLGGPGGARLLFRWYKTSSEIDTAGWIEQLARRGRPPLAILGGENSERALSTAQVLEARRGRWRGPDPLFLITTATADNYAGEGAAGEQPLTAPGTPRLMDVYKGRSFRFSFTNSRMAAVVISFVKNHPEVWSHSPHYAASAAGPVAAADLPTALALLACRERMSAVSFYAVAWADDPYSKDLADRFGEVFQQRFMEPDQASPWEDARLRIRDVVPYGVGDRDRPNPAEAAAIDRFFRDNPLMQGSRQLLVLPTGTEKARRFVRTLANQAPLEMSNLAVLSGDSITFNNVYRDRDAAWNIQDLPVPLVFFTHRNPISRTAGFRPRARPGDPSAATGTQDLLLYRDLINAVVQAAHVRPGLLGDAEQAAAGLRQLRWLGGHLRPDGDGRPFFNADGDRSAGTGEHVVWVHPVRDGGRVLAQATISVWRLQTERDGRLGWHPAAEPLKVSYDWPPRVGGQ